MAEIVYSLEDDGNIKEVAVDTTTANSNEISISESSPEAAPVPSRPWLRPWQPGQSGNPNGRPKTPVEFRRLAQEAAPDALAAVIAIMNDPNARAADRARAAELVMDRALGKPAQETYIGGISGNPLELTNGTPALDTSKLSDAQRSALADILQTMVSADG